MRAYKLEEENFMQIDKTWKLRRVVRGNSNVQTHQKCLVPEKARETARQVSFMLVPE